MGQSCRRLQAGLANLSDGLVRGTDAWRPFALAEPPRRALPVPPVAMKVFAVRPDDVSKAVVVAGHLETEVQSDLTIGLCQGGEFIATSTDSKGWSAEAEPSSTSVSTLVRSAAVIEGSAEPS